jgi:RNA polymerase sigma-70 factor (ECF subfamily)
VLDAESFAALLTDCYQRCWLVAAAVTGDRVEADDIVQEASIIALRKLGDFTTGTNFGAWISQIVRLTALNHLKKTARHNIVVTDPQAIDQAEATGRKAAKSEAAPVNEIGALAEHQVDFDDAVLRALKGVSDTARACLLLRVVNHLSYADIAQTLEIPEGTAMSHVHRAKHAIRDQLKGGQPAAQLSDR